MPLSEYIQHLDNTTTPELRQRMRALREWVDAERAKLKRVVNNRPTRYDHLGEMGQPWEPLTF